MAGVKRKKQNTAKRSPPKIVFPAELVRAYQEKKKQKKKDKILLSVFSISLVIFFGIGAVVFIPKMPASKVVNGIKIKQEQIIAGQKVKWTTLVPKNQIKDGRYLAQLPRNAKNIKITIASAKEAQNILAAEPIQQLSLLQRKQLSATLLKNPGNNRIFSASLSSLFKYFFSNIVISSKYLFADLSSGVDNAVQSITGNEINQDLVQTPDATYVNVSSNNESSTTGVVPTSMPDFTPTTETPAPSTGSEQLGSQTTPPVSETTSDYVAIEYETPAPQIMSEATDTGQQVTVSATNEDPQAPLVDVLASTKIPEIFKVGQENKIKIKWQNQGNQEVAFHAYDTDGNGKLDYVEWTIPHLSEQVFDIIFISKAFRLDADRQISEDIYDTVATQDNKWATIHNNEWLRFTFEHPVDQGKTIDIYAKPTDLNQSATIEIYRENDNQIVATQDIDRESYYHVPMTSLGNNPTDVFDFKITGSVDIDYVQDDIGSEDNTLTISTGADSGGVWDGGNFDCDDVDNVLNTNTLTNKLNAYSAVTVRCVYTTISNNITWSAVGHSLYLIGSSQLDLGANVTGPGDVSFPTGNGMQITTANATVNTSSGNGAVYFSNPMRSPSSTFTFVVNSGSGAIIVGRVGTVQPLGSLKLTTSGAVSLYNNITTNGEGGVDLSGCSGSITLDDNIAIDTSAGNGPVNLVRQHLTAHKLFQ